MSDQGTIAPIQTDLEVVPPPDPWSMAGYILLDQALIFLQNGAISFWQKNVGPQIGEIGSRLIQMGQDINDIVPRVERGLLKQTLSTFNTEVQAHSAALEGVMVRNVDRIVPPDDLTEVKVRKIDITTRVGQLVNDHEYGFAGYPGVITGFGAMILAYKLLQSDRSEVKAFIVNPIQNYLVKAIDPQVSGSLETGRISAQSQARTAEDSFTSLLGRRWRVCHEQIEDPNGIPGGGGRPGWPIISDTELRTNRPHYYRIVVFSGSVNDPNIRVAVESFTDTYNRPTDPWLPGLPKEFDWGERDTAVQYSTDLLRRLRDIAVARRAAAEKLEGCCRDLRECIDRVRKELSR